MWCKKCCRPRGVVIGRITFEKEQNYFYSDVCTNDEHRFRSHVRYNWFIVTGGEHLSFARPNLDGSKQAGMHRAMCCVTCQTSPQVFISGNLIWLPIWPWGPQIWLWRHIFVWWLCHTRWENSSGSKFANQSSWKPQTDLEEPESECWKPSFSTWCNRAFTEMSKRTEPLNPGALRVRGKL